MFADSAGKFVLSFVLEVIDSVIKSVILNKGKGNVSMVRHVIGESASTTSIMTLVKKVHSSSPAKSSLYEEAITYFSELSDVEEKLTPLKKELAATQKRLAENDLGAKTSRLERRADTLSEQIKALEMGKADTRLARLIKLEEVCDQILSLCLGKTAEETNNKFAKVLGTILLNSPSRKKSALLYNQRSKNFYQAVLSLKLLDQLLENNLISNEYILERARYIGTDQEDLFRTQVQVPLLICALLQDVGIYHPDSQKILKGENGDQDEFRTLDNNERVTFLKTQYSKTLQYIVLGLGKARYTGRSRSEQQAFDKAEKEKLAFMQTLLKSSIVPKQGVGNLLKVPQIYTSIVLSTKPNFVYASLPKAFLVLNKGAERGSHSQEVVDSLLEITGVFPQGFGVTYIPKDSGRYDSNRYEYAIVNRLYPSHPQQPICRVVTRNLVFNSHGINHHISPENNLYFPKARKKLEKVSDVRLREILSKLRANFNEHQELEELIPSHWHTQEYFSYVKNQNLWNKEVALTN